MRHAFSVLAFVVGSALAPALPATAADTMSDADVEFLAGLCLRGLRYDHPKVRGAAASTLVSLPRVPDRARKGLLELYGSPKAREKCVFSVAYVLARQGAGVVPDIVALARRGDAEALKTFVEALLRAGPAGKDSLKALLASRDAEVRASVLPHAGTLGEDAGPFLAEAVGARDADVFVRIARGLGEGTPGQLALPALREVVKSWEDERARTAAARLLARMGPGARGALPDLLSAMKGASLAEGLEFAKAAWKIGGDAAPLVEAARAVLASGPVPEGAPHAIRLEAARSLRELGESARPALPEMLVALEGGPRAADSPTRAEILRALPPLGPETLDHVLRFVEDKRPEVRRAAAEALAGYAPDAEAPVGTLAKLLEDKDVVVRRFAAKALSRHGRRALPAAERLARMLGEVGSPDLAATARAAEEALVAIGPGAKEHVLASTTSRASWERLFAARVLASYGPSAVEDIEKMLSPKTTRLGRVGAAVTLMTLVGAEAVPKAAELARRKDEGFRRAGLASLALIQPEGVEQLKAIFKESEDLPVELLSLAEEGIRGAGIPRERQRELLLGLMEEDVRELRAFAAKSLSGWVYRKGGGEAMPSLVEMLSDRDPRVRKAGIEGLAKLYDVRDETAPHVARMTTDFVPSVREAAYKALSTLRGRELLRALLAALVRERDPKLRQLAAYAFGRKPQAIPALLRMMDRETGPRAEVAAKALRCCGPLTVLVYVDFYKSGDPAKKRMAGEALQALGDVAAPALFEMLE
ncbi:MAG: HEAT repeat domain-containing protein [Planctomycetota bacterium]